MDSKVLYIDLLKKTLTDYHRINVPEYKPINNLNYSWKVRILNRINKRIVKRGFCVCQKTNYNPNDRYEGRDWPSFAETMIGIKRLENIEFCINEILKENILGDLIETGVWRGGATIFMKAVLKVNDDNIRKVWVADSFEGLPKPNEKEYPEDKGDVHYTKKELVISLDTVQENFRKYDMLDENVVFLKGWFKDTLPVAPIEKLALIRLDGDMYESTMDGLTHLYPKLSTGGYIIIDDWNAVKGCKQAVLDYRKTHNITEEIITIDWASVYWKKRS